VFQNSPDGMKTRGNVKTYHGFNLWKIDRCIDAQCWSFRESLVVLWENPKGIPFLCFITSIAFLWANFSEITSSFLVFIIGGYLREKMDEYPGLAYIWIWIASLNKSWLFNICYLYLRTKIFSFMAKFQLPWLFFLCLTWPRLASPRRAYSQPLIMFGQSYLCQQKKNFLTYSKRFKIKNSTHLVF